MIRTFRYRLYPTKAQERLMEKTLETCRRWYNQCLAERRDAWDERGERVTRFQQCRQITPLRAANSYMGAVPHHVLQVVVKDLDKAFQAFFRRVKSGQTPGFPRFKSRNRFDSFGYQEYGAGFKVDGRRLRLTWIGRVAVRWHRPLEGRIKTARIVRCAGEWYVCFACEVEPTPLPPTGRDVGIDVGIASLITTSEGEKVAHPARYRAAERKLRVLQRRVSRRKKGGVNRRKAVLMLQRQHERVRNQRNDVLNKLAHSLITRYDRIALENLTIRNMLRNPRVAKSILDAGWGYLIERLTSKAEEAGRVVSLVDRRYTSKTCSQCGSVFEGLTLKDRWVRCACGLSLDRDHNAAINILNRAGQARWAPSPPVGGLAQEAVQP